LLKRSKDARALAIEFGKTVLEIRDLLIRGIVYRYALSRFHDETEHHSWGSKSNLSTHAPHDPLQRIAGILMSVAVDDERFSTSFDCQRADSNFASAVRMSKQR
jgi:hypothetical protein